MSKKRETKTNEKQKAIYAEYVELLKSCGDYAPYLSRSYLYDQIAEKFFVESEYIRKVINGGGRIKTNDKVKG